MTNSNSNPPTNVTTLRQLARQLECGSSAYAGRIWAAIITGIGILLLIVLSKLGRNAPIASVFITVGIVTFSIASRAAHRVAIYRNTLTDRMLGAIADSDSIPGWAKEEVAGEYVARGYVPLATLTKIVLLIVEERQTEHTMKNLTPGADRLIARYGKATDNCGTIDRRAQ